MLALPKFIAHRGASLIAPENTLVSLREAKKQGASYVEFDVQLTGDGHPVVFHDSELDRTTNGRGKVSDVDYETIARLDAGSWFNEKFKNERVPTLADYLQCAADSRLGINVELKGTRDQARQLAKVVVESLDFYWSSDLPEPLISSASIFCLQAVKSISSDYWLGYIMDKWETHWIDIINPLHCISLHLAHELLTPERIHAIKAAKKLLLAYTVNDPLLANRLLQMGVDAIFSDSIYFISP